MIQKKICMLGAFAVGKTSLVARFVTSRFSEKYHTTVGVKIDRKDVQVDDQSLRLLIWDLAGEDELMKVRTSYLRGAAGYLLVVDGTRRQTFDVALDLRGRIEQEVGVLPYVLLANKDDLQSEWELGDADFDPLHAAGVPIVYTSAKSGQHVEGAFQKLARTLGAT